MQYVGTSFAITITSPDAEGKVTVQRGLFGFDKFCGVGHYCELGIAVGDKQYWVYPSIIRIQPTKICSKRRDISLWRS